MAFSVGNPTVRRSTRLSALNQKAADFDSALSLPTPSPTVTSPIPLGTAETASSPLSSLLPSAEGLPLDFDYQIPKITKPHRHDQESITIDEADRRSNPAKGGKLTQLVREARNAGILPRCYGLSVVRFVDGLWMVPLNCQNCLAENKNCNLGRPCSACKRASKHCDRNGTDLMVIVASHKPQPIARPSVAAKNTIFHGLHGQNEDSTWYHIIPTSPVSADAIFIAKDDENKFAFQNDLLKDSVDLLDINESESEPEKNSQDKDCTTRKRKTSQKETLEPRKRAKVVSLKEVVAQRAENEKSHNSRPRPHGRPPVLSGTRQALCETLPWFKAYQSSAYTHDGLVHGVLFDGGVSPRDHFDGAVIISTIGGGKEADEQGNMVQTKNQCGATVAAFKRTMVAHMPVGVVTGSRNVKFPVRLEVYYSVLDWFHITDIWCEKSNGVTTWMFRLEKIDLVKPSWWLPEGTQHALPDFGKPKSESFMCITCSRRSKIIYSAGWTCLNERCTKHFDFGDGLDVRSLSFSKAFIDERTDYSTLVDVLPGTLAPPPPALKYSKAGRQTAYEKYGVEKLFKRGIVCPKCNHCIQRLEWKQWSCTNCTYIYSLPAMVIDATVAINQSSRLPTADSLIYLEPGKQVFHTLDGLYDIHVYPFTGLDGELVGHVVHLKSNSAINEQIDGPDDLFRQMQMLDLGMKRGAARLKGKPGQMVTSHFATNWGAPYKYGVAQDSKGFDEAPVTIIKAVKRLTWAGRRAISECIGTSEAYYEPNELLTIGYFEDSTIGYHDDGEKELGPTVASLSLGCSATMSWRPKAKAAIGKTSRNQKGTKPDVLQIRLDHGDLMVMHGAKIQELYEHAVTPHGKIRFALTGRYMVPEKIKTQTDRDIAATKGALPAGHQQYDYHGDTNLMSRSDKRSRRDDASDIMNVATLMWRNNEITKEELSNRLSGVIAAI